MGYHDYAIMQSIQEVAKGVKSIGDSLNKIANSYAKKQSPNTYNVYVTTSGAETTKDVAAAVQSAIKAAERNANS